MKEGRSYLLSHAKNELAIVTWAALDQIDIRKEILAISLGRLDFGLSSSRG